MAENNAEQSANGADLLDAAADDSPSRTALDQVRVYLAELAGVLDQQEPDLYLPEAQWRLAELNDELAHERPSAPRVQSRWMRLIPVLRELRPDIPTEQLTELIKRAVGVG
ncbi:hypothetical protein GCM10009854_04480 [Saccharopolyspora halophila]|uniref:Uncharacterized protein n=1 Tax=Saccharopolyspora halophila TaxID=405551 RepID=A0ABP5SLS1_9PSEU